MADGEKLPTEVIIVDDGRKDRKPFQLAEGV